MQGRISTKSQTANEVYLPIVFMTRIHLVSPTKTPKSTQTRTATRTRAPFRSSTPIPTSTQTPTNTLTPTITLTPTSTATITLIPLPSITIQYPSHTPSITPSITIIPSQTPSPTPPSGLFSTPESSTWILVILVSLLWVILAILIYLFLRRREGVDGGEDSGQVEDN